MQIKITISTATGLSVEVHLTYYSDSLG